jgi:hypothetical protein
MQAWEESGYGVPRQHRRDYDDFDEMDDDELGPDEESEFAVRYMDDDEDGDDEEEAFGSDDPFELDDEGSDGGF